MRSSSNPSGIDKIKNNISKKYNRPLLVSRQERNSPLASNHNEIELGYAKTMAPSNRIWTLNDVTNNHRQESRAPSSSNSSSNTRNKDDDDNDNEQATKSSSSIASYPLASSRYCRPVNDADANRGNNISTTIPLHHIPNLPMADACASTLERLQEEFSPIIRRRGYDIRSISEICCCGDGLDFVKGRRRKLGKQSSNVWGYNRTKFMGRSKTHHTIHLRLRNPNRHEHQLLSWEDVAGTMAHELSHCVHQNHSPAFYKLMEEILDEHASNLVNGLQFTLNTTRNTAAAAVNTTTTTATPTIPSSGGQRLGGNSNKGKSRLLETGQKLGGRQHSVHKPANLRELMARAAEARTRQLELARRRMERWKEPCVIEILDDDDEEEEVPVDINKMPPPTKRPSKETKPNAKAKKKSKVTECIDLTKGKDGVDDDVGGKIRMNTAPANTQQEWSCTQCTFQNKPSHLVCDVCLSEKS